MKKTYLQKTIIFIYSLTLLSFIFVSLLPVSAQELDSPNYTIVDPTFDGGGGISNSGNYSLLSSIDPNADSRLSSGSYAIGSGFGNGIFANIPKVRCAESDTIAGTTTCVNFPKGAGAQGECGTPGCYDRIKIEIDHQNNPVDTLYLIGILDTNTATQYYLQNDHTISTTYDINDYMTICALEGKDTRSGSGCASSSDPGWDVDLQSTNVFNLAEAHTYTIKVRALQGDFTESNWSPTVNVTTKTSSISFDVDIADGTGASAENPAPYAVSLGSLTPNVVKTATNRVWLDLNTNIVAGMSVYVKDINGGLKSGANTIASQTENLAVDSNNNGGYGVKTASFTQASLGPILADSTFNTTPEHAVGAVSTTQDLIFSTNTTGNNVGQVTNGRASVFIKALAKDATPTGSYTDTITFIMIGNI